MTDAQSPLSRSVRNVDIYDGHLLESIDVGEDALWHEVIHPLTCPGGCAVDYAVEVWGEEFCWDRIETPGLRIIGWRHDELNFGPRGVEHDLVCWAEPEDITDLVEVYLDR